MEIRMKICLLLNIYVMFASAQDDDSTVEIVTIETTTQEIIIITDLSQAEVEDALKVEEGEYTTMVFDYINSQFYDQKPSEKCFNDYIKCILTLGITLPVCAVSHYHYRTYNTYCDLYLENCRSVYRNWWIIDSGYCNYYQGTFTDVDLTYRRLGMLVPRELLFELLAPNYLRRLPRIIVS